jgi:CelD/BcsL family acetyltransferase involved in cellulose biosynthesis
MLANSGYRGAAAISFAGTAEHEASSSGVYCEFISANDAVQSPEFQAAWRVLEQGAGEPNPFYAQWFLRPALQSFDPGNAVSIFMLWQGKSDAKYLIGIMPIADQSVYGRWPIAHISNWLHHNAFLGAPLILAGQERVFWQALLGALDDRGGKSMFLHLNGLVAGGALQTALCDLCTEEQRPFALVSRQERAFLEGQLSAEAYYNSVVRSKKRKELRRQKNRLAEMGDLQFRRHDGRSDLARWTDEFLALERRGWKGLNGSALDCAPDTREMFRNALQGAALQGELELLELRLDGVPLAMLVNFICGRGSFSFKTAFDEDYARFSPGVLLQIENLGLLERAGTDWCDSCAAEGHPMIDSLWSGRREIGRYSVAIGGFARRKAFGLLIKAETARMAKRLKKNDTKPRIAMDDEL